MRNYPNVEVLVGSAGLDQTLCARLLNGDRRRVIGDFCLSATEQEAILAVQATSLPEFAAALLGWMERQDGLSSTAG